MGVHMLYMLCERINLWQRDGRRTQEQERSSDRLSVKLEAGNRD